MSSYLLPKPNKSPYETDNKKISNNFLTQDQKSSVGNCLADFQIISELGRGSYGIVYKVISQLDKNIYVLKKIDILHMNKKHQKEALKEASILKKIKQKSIIKYYTSFVESDGLHIVMEYADGGDLQQLGDLGVAKVLANQMAQQGTRVGTPLYLAPELVKQQPYDQKIDIWAIGCVLYFICCLEPPFKGDNLIQLGYNIVNKQPNLIPSEYSLKLQNFISKLFEKDPNNRPSADSLVENFPYSVQIEENVKEKEKNQIINKLDKYDNTHKSLLNLSKQRPQSSNNYNNLDIKKKEQQQPSEFQDQYYVSYKIVQDEQIQINDEQKTNQIKEQKITNKLTNNNEFQIELQKDNVQNSCKQDQQILEIQNNIIKKNQELIEIIQDNQNNISKKNLQQKLYLQSNQNPLIPQRNKKLIKSRQENQNTNFKIRPYSAQLQTRIKVNNQQLYQQLNEKDEILDKQEQLLQEPQEPIEPKEEPNKPQIEVSPSLSPKNKMIYDYENMRPRSAGLGYQKKIYKNQKSAFNLFQFDSINMCESPRTTISVQSANYRSQKSIVTNFIKNNLRNISNHAEYRPISVLTQRPQKQSFYANSQYNTIIAPNQFPINIQQKKDFSQPDYYRYDFLKANQQKFVDDDGGKTQDNLSTEDKNKEIQKNKDDKKIQNNIYLENNKQVKLKLNKIEYLIKIENIKNKQIHNSNILKNDFSKKNCSQSSLRKKFSINDFN